MTNKGLLRGVVLSTLALLLAGCAIPRGAALQSEVVGIRPVTGEITLDPNGGYAVYPVTSESLPVIAQWPAITLENDSSRLSWLRRQPQTPSVIIAAGDTVNVTVWDNGQNSLLVGEGGRLAQLQGVVVSPSGTLNLPYLGDVEVGGLSTDAARTRIEQLYAQTLPSVQVQMNVTPGRSNAVNLVSGMNAPGIYPMVDRDMTVLAAISQAGGVAPTLVNPQVRLMRGSNVYGIQLSRLLAEPALDTTLRGGDRIMVMPESRSFLSLGATGQQARIVFPEEKVTALGAISLMGGVSAERADLSGILVLRNYAANAVRADGTSGPPNQRMIFALDLTSADGLFSAGQFQIMPNDVVYGTESPLTSTRTVIGMIGSLVGVANSVQ
ncbi:polysaccharide biosynthesis/export protein [Ketogulonicigenium robustum]|uniref:Polysaccharide biosynthesis/export protein n=1 Tax=Ketogulonicigenium robustum TaxID=92947 RepID=A0A1W6P266_9RHOB|nr:polysaccharide biosynthesis/export family protein [Ketogulonicigenium robustum]ARO15481.1 polysaccharide biosynthesis/export protein [Ketogulonicigenium robustum]